MTSKYLIIIALFLGVSSQKYYIKPNMAPLSDLELNKLSNSPEDTTGTGSLAQTHTHSRTHTRTRTHTHNKDEWDVLEAKAEKGRKMRIAEEKAAETAFNKRMADKMAELKRDHLAHIARNNAATAAIES